MDQVAKIFLAGVHCINFIVPVYLAQSRTVPLKIVGYATLVVYFLFAIFWVGFFPYFGFVPELYSYGGANAADLSKVVGHYFQQLFGYRECILLLICALLFYLLPRYRLPTRGLLIVLLPVSLFSASVYNFGTPVRNDVFGNATVLRRFGPVAFSYVSLSEWMNADGLYLAAETQYPGKVIDIISPDSNEEKPIFSIPQNAKRVILVQIESFDPEAIDAELSGVKVMPFVSDLRDKCLNYSNFFTMKGAGGSSDAEFAVATGLIPSSRLPSLRQTDFARIQTTYDILAARGIKSSFAHNNNAGFYGRDVAYQRLDNIAAQFQKPSEIIEEVTFAENALEASLDASEKVFHYFFNFQSHGPYRGYSEITRDKFSIVGSTDIKTDYLATMSEVDQMIESLFSIQRAQFEMGENLFILTADHPSQIHTKNDNISKFRIPAMICHESFHGENISEVFGTIDIQPTIFEAFGLEPDNEIIGKSMFQKGKNAVLLPHGILIQRNNDGKVVAKRCSEKCRPYIDYTEQFIMLKH